MKKFLLLLLILTGCGSLRTSRLDILVNSSDVNNRTNIMPGLSQAAAEWSEALGIEIDIKVGNWQEENLNHHRYLLKLKSMPVINIAIQDACNSIINFNCNYIFTDIDFNRQIFLHELGHVFGVPHNENIESDIMYPFSSSKNSNSCLSIDEIEIAKKNWLSK